MTMSSIRTSKSAKIAAPIFGAALLFGTAACGDDSAGPNEGTTLEDVNTAEEDGGVLDDEDSALSEDEIAAAPNAEYDDDTETFFSDPTALLDENVTVSGEVVQVFGPESFVIGQDDLATLVVVGPDVELTPEVGTVAQVTGDVGTFVLVDVETDFGYDFEDEDFVDFEQAPFIAADNLNLLDQED